jgi:hypothetical protein
MPLVLIDSLKNDPFLASLKTSTFFLPMTLCLADISSRISNTLFEQFIAYF